MEDDENNAGVVLEFNAGMKIKSGTRYHLDMRRHSMYKHEGEVLLAPGNYEVMGFDDLGSHVQLKLKNSCRKKCLQVVWFPEEKDPTEKEMQDYMLGVELLQKSG